VTSPVRQQESNYMSDCKIYGWKQQGLQILGATWDKKTLGIN